MQLLVYCLTYPFIWLISKLPWKLFYAFSTAIYYLIYYIVGYRKKVVTQNLVLVFPEKSPEEIKKIRKGFYKHMCDMFLEMIKSLDISNDEMKERFKIINIEKVRELEKQGKNIMVMMAHYASYEWSNATDIQTNFQAVGIYKKIRNKYFDRLARRIRARFGSRVISSRNARKEISEDQGKNNGLYMYGLVSDQTPKLYKAKYWTDFMNIKVPVFLGAEVLAKQSGMNVYYLKVEKVKRGYYEGEFITLSEDSSNCKD